MAEVIVANIKIVTDSSIQLTAEEIKEHHITVIPLTIMIDNTVYIDGETITRDQFMTEMAGASALPKTSQPAIGNFIETYENLAADGSQILSIHMLRAISGTVDTARQAGEMAKADVTVIDSDFTDRAMAFQVLKAAEVIGNGGSMADALTAIQTVHDHTKLYMGVTDLTNLVKGGRLSHAAGVISSLLNIKVILEVADSELKVLRKGRGMKTITKFIDEMEANLRELKNVKAIGISHADGLELSQKIQTQLQAVFPNIEILVRTTDPVIATHAGAGAFAVMYYTED